LRAHPTDPRRKDAEAPQHDPVADLEAEVSALAAQNNELTRVAEDLRRQVERAERLRRETVAAIDGYHARFHADLKLFRSQRAWQVMLWVRKAYTVLVRSLEQRRLPSPGSVLSLMFRPSKQLDVYDLRLPDLKHTLPLGLRHPFPIDLPDESERAESRHYLDSSPPPQRKYDVVVLPVFEFDFRCQRPQHLAMQFAAAGHRVFWISPSRTCPPEQPYEALELESRIWEVHVRAPLPNIYLGELRMQDVDEAAACLEALYRDFAVAESCAVLELPFWRRLGIRLRERFDTKLLYDCMDDWQTMPEISAFNRSEEARLAAECNVLIATGKHLVERHTAAGRAPVLVRNGADFERFSAAQPEGALKDIRRPIVGYFGAIADWFDYNLYCEVAKSRPDYSFVLIGAFGLEEKPSHAEALRLAELSNVQLLGHKPYAEIPAYLAAFDVCTIPFVLNEVTKATDPVKLYEYLSQGKPVVATPMSELREAGELISIAATAEEFARAVDAAVHENAGAEIRRRRVEFASTQRWTDRWRVMDEAIRGAFPLVSILVVTYNSAEYVDLCFESLLRHTSYPSFEVIAVDNASGDATAERLEAFARRDGRIRVIRNERNLGFAGGNNQAAGLARGEYLVMLNADTIVTPCWLERLLRHCATRPQVGMAGPVTNQIGNEAKIRVDYRDMAGLEEFARQLASDRFDESREMRTAALFCALISRELWNRVGPLDERFRVGMFEDDDLSVRVRNAGLRIVSAEDCFVHHFGQGSFAKLRPAEYQEIFATNRRLFEEKWETEWIEHEYREGVRPDEGMYRSSDFRTGGAPSGRMTAFPRSV
jgi:GT2 family glycosyltransferase/glycosyltransferase involved in cell wall biosynthesis